MTIDGNKLMMLLNDWWYSSFGYDEETEDSKAIKTVMDKIEKNLKDLMLESCEDAISRAGAVKVASGYCHPANVAKELAKLPPVTPKPTECEDAISRQAAIDALGEKPLDWTEDEYELGLQNQWKYDVDAIKALPPVTPIRPKGHWIEIAQYSDGKHKIECSECKGHIFSRGHANSFVVKNEYKFCPHCGKRMIGPQESEKQK